jgi:NAD+ kinase
MSEHHEVLESEPAPRAMPSRLGLVVHPTRAIERPLGELRRWADRHGVELVQVHILPNQQRVADEGDPEDCDLLVAIGGDGTTLGALHAGVVAARPVLAVACGSLGALTSVPAAGVVQAIERFVRGDWVPRLLPGLEIAGELGMRRLALNDLAVVRASTGQARLIIELDGNLYVRTAGDGCIVSTPIGSSAYTLAARGPLLTPELDAFVITPLPTHGGSCPPLVVSATSSLRLQAAPGHGGARLELDGQRAGMLDDPLTITFQKAVATVVKFSGQAPMLEVLRERGIIADSPRIRLDEARERC